MADPKVTWRIGVDDNATAALRRIDAQISGVSKTFRTLAGFGGFAIITAGVTSLARKVFDLASELQDASDKLGVSAEALQRLKGAAEATGGSFESIQTAMVFLAKTTDAAVQGSDEAAESFRRLGIDANKFAQIPLDRRLAIIAHQLNQIPDPAERVALAVKVMGRSAADNIPLLANLDAEMKKINVTLSDEQVKALDEAKDAWDRWGNAGVVWTGKALVGLEDVYKWLQKSAVGKFAEQSALGGGADPRRKRPSTRVGRGGPAGPLSPDETAAIIGLPGRKDADAALKNFRKITDEVDALLAKSMKGEHHESLQATESLKRFNEEMDAWNQKLEDQQDILEDIKTPFDRYVEALEKIKDLQSVGLLTDDQALKAQKKAFEDLSRTSEKATLQVTSRTDELLKNIKDATQGFAHDITSIFFDTTQSIGDMFESLFKRIAEMIVEQSVIQPLLDLIAGAIGGLGGPAEIDVSKFPTRRAGGGPVWSGSPYLVGEQGPELFVPRQNGQVVPAGGVGMPALQVTVVSPDPNASAAILLSQERLLTNMIRRAMIRAGNRPNL